MVELFHIGILGIFFGHLWHADPALGLLVVPADVAEAADGHDPRRRLRRADRWRIGC
jgi:hypothetical protein